MENEQFSIEQIEGYCLGLLPRTETELLEQEMAKDQQLQNRVSQIQTILDAFLAARTQAFSEQLDLWQKDAMDRDRLELIEWYLNDELGPKARQAVEKKRDEDPAFAQLIQDQQKLFSLFDAKRTEDFANKMKQWENGGGKAKKRLLYPLIRRVAIAASFLLLISIGSLWLISRSYSGPALFESYYQAPAFGGTMGETDDNNDFANDFAKAHRHLQSNEYQEALELLKQLQTKLPNEALDKLSSKFFAENIEWSVILAQLGLDKEHPQYTGTASRSCGASRP